MSSTSYDHSYVNVQVVSIPKILSNGGVYKISL